MLKISGLEVSYGIIKAIKGISFEVKKGEIVALIGANGAGKTTVLHTITGLIRANAGSILFEEHEITKTPAHKIVFMGMGHIPEGRRIFRQLTVYENLMLGAYSCKDKKETSDTLAKVYRRFPRLEERKSRLRGRFRAVNNRCLQWAGRLCPIRK